MVSGTIGKSALRSFLEKALYRSNSCASLSDAMPVAEKLMEVLGVEVSSALPFHRPWTSGSSGLSLRTNDDEYTKWFLDLSAIDELPYTDNLRDLIAYIVKLHNAELERSGK